MACYRFWYNNLPNEAHVRTWIQFFFSFVIIINGNQCWSDFVTRWTHSYVIPLHPIKLLQAVLYNLLRCAVLSILTIPARMSTLYLEYYRYNFVPCYHGLTRRSFRMKQMASRQIESVPKTRPQMGGSYSSGFGAGADSHGVT
jgi:hypothetical protein